MEIFISYLQEKQKKKVDGGSVFVVNALLKAVRVVLKS